MSEKYGFLPQYRIFNMLLKTTDKNVSTPVNSFLEHTNTVDRILMISTIILRIFIKIHLLLSSVKNKILDNTETINSCY